MSQATIVTTLEFPWTRIDPVLVGRDISKHCAPERFVIVQYGEEDRLRIDLYRSHEEGFAFTEACVWSDFVAIGWGHCLYLVDLRTRSLSLFELGNYFGHLYPRKECLLVASAERLFRIEPEGLLLWRTDPLGIDGVVVGEVANGIIRGDGEWDPPGGWRPFEVSLRSGERANNNDE